MAAMAVALLATGAPGAAAAPARAEPDADRPGIEKVRCPPRTLEAATQGRTAPRTALGVMRGSWFALAMVGHRQSP